MMSWVEVVLILLSVFPSTREIGIEVLYLVIARVFL